MCYTRCSCYKDSRILGKIPQIPYEEEHVQATCPLMIYVHMLVGEASYTDTIVHTQKCQLLTIPFKIGL
uniref:Uncharacterized protein MANES_11G061100 n=1 Tax=Rhizophora mucronata TaxID=61149 RepID=A0A2P2MD21_RHIMU